MRINETLMMFGTATIDPIAVGAWVVSFNSPVGTPVANKIGSGGTMITNLAQEPIGWGLGAGGNLSLNGIRQAAAGVGSLNGTFVMSFKIS